SVFGIDAHSQGRAPDEIFYEIKFIAGLCKNPRTRTFQSLNSRDVLIRLKIELHLRDAVRPNDAGRSDLSLIAESKVRARRNNRRGSNQSTGANFDSSADPKIIDAPIANGALCPS